MSNFNQNKWKYLSFGLTGIAVVWLLVPQANAATKETHQQIMDLLNGIKPNTDKIPTIDSNVAAIKSKTDSLSSEPERALSLNGLTLNPPDGGTATYDIVPAEEGKLYTGTIYWGFVNTHSVNNEAYIDCGIAGPAARRPILGTGATTTFEVPIPFGCTYLQFVVVDKADGNDDNPANFEDTMIKYTVTDMSAIS